MTYPIQLDRTYILRNGRRVYIARWHDCDTGIAIGYGDDGICHHYNRADGTSRLCFGYNGGPVLNDPCTDIVGESIGLDDLKEEYYAYEAYAHAQRCEWERVRDLPDGYETYRKWCRANRPPGPLGSGMRESDYDEKVASPRWWRSQVAREMTPGNLRVETQDENGRWIEETA